ncbi:MAG: ABC transporter permease [Myxococcales bacterium]|nr:ABC transporter permease [Myxococcales bacterium]
MSLAPAPPPSPTRTERWAERTADRLNPIVVKEIRQGLRTKVFWVCFALMLFACLVLSLVAFAAARERAFDSGGREFFYAYFFCLGVVQFFVIPYSAYRSLAREREEETWVLLTLTGLGPRRILLGKLGSFLVQAMLYGSAAGPFLVFSYYLNGIDLPTILLVLALGAAYTAFLTALSVSAATLAEQRFLRALTHFGVLGVLIGGTALGLSVAYAITEDSSLLRDDDFLPAMGGCLWAMLSYGALLFEAAAARLSLPTESYARGVRLAFLVQAVLSAGIGVYAWVHENLDEEVALVAQLLGCIHLGVVGLLLATDVDGMVGRHRVGTRIFSLLRPGALRGYRLVMVVLGLSSALWGTLCLVSPGSVEPEELSALIACGAYVALYVSLPILVTRLIPFPPYRAPAVARLSALALLFLAGGAPPLAAAIITGDPAEPAFNVFNPFVGVVNFAERRADSGWELLLLCAVAAISALAADHVLARRDAPKSAQAERAPSPEGA